MKPPDSRLTKQLLEVVSLQMVGRVIAKHKQKVTDNFQFFQYSTSHREYRYTIERKQWSI